MSELMSAALLPTDKLQENRVISNKATHATVFFSPTGTSICTLRRGVGAVSCSLLLVNAFISEVAAICTASLMMINRPQYLHQATLKLLHGT